MKKVFPYISILIVLSMIGLIYFQYKFLSETFANKEADYIERFSNATFAIREELTVMKDRQILEDNILIGGAVIQKSFADGISEVELRDIIRRNLKNNNLDKVKYEYALGRIYKENDLFEPILMSENWEKTYENNTHFLNTRTEIGSLSGTDSENLLPLEGFWMNIPVYEKKITNKEMLPVSLAAILFTSVILGTFYISVNTMLKQKKLSEIKNDFINNMTHELKTPLATISLAIDAIRNEKVKNNEEKMNYFTSVIKDENKRMNKQVETILQSAQLEKQEIQLNLKEHHAHDLIKVATQNIELPIAEKNGKLIVELHAKNDLMKVDEVHFTNLVNNLLDNAMKYSKEGDLTVKISTQNIGKQFKIKIDDNGIGMSKDTLNRIFEKFYRAHTGNIHNVKGFGLGLSYVKALVEAHGGTIKAESILGKGSTFTVSMPMK